MDETQASVVSELSQNVDRLASNLGLNRRPAVGAQGIVIVYRSSPLIQSILLPSGTKFFSPSLNQEYAATESLNITSMTYDPISGKFVASVPVQAVNTGVGTVAAIGQVTVMRSGIANIEGVTNTSPLVGGRDEESDRELATRTKTALSASNIGTKSGYRLLLLGLNTIHDVSIVGAGDPLMARDLGDGGSVDAYLIDPLPVQVVEAPLPGTVTPIPTVSPTSWSWIPSRQPLINDLTLINPTPTNLTKDATVYAGSTRARDSLLFASDPTGNPVSYFTNNNVLQTQTFIDDDSRKILGSDVLAKEAITVLVYVTFRIVVLSGFSQTVVQTNVLNAVTQMISSLGIGVSLEQSDLLKAALNTPGVDRVDLPLIRFDRGVAGILNVIQATANETLRVGAVIVNL
jgi:uncharacterized phage protein gp47/JayE